MDAPTQDLRHAILERAFPDLRFGGDPDIERYFELRRAGRMMDALAVYTSRLKKRYPDDAKRVYLLKLYRVNSPIYQSYLEGLLMERADEMIDRIRLDIEALTAPLDGVPLRNAYAVLKSVERIARFLPGDGERALAVVSAYEDYAKLLSFRQKEMARSAYLLSEFYSQARPEQDEAPDFVADSLREEEGRRQLERERERKNFFDLSRIRFEKEDLRRIEIPQGIERDEDKALAFCHKYWHLVADSAFERVLWLYSHKYGTKHYAVFKAIKTGRIRKYPDDDILSLVATTIADRYSYTVQGDVYMQAAWRRIKASLYTAGTTPQPEAPASAGTARSKPPTRSKAASRKKSSTPAPPVGRTDVRREDIEPRVKKGKLERAEAFPAVLAPQAHEALKAPPIALAGGSISDTIKRLSGKAYDVYRDIFLAKVQIGRAHV